MSVTSPDNPHDNPSENLSDSLPVLAGDALEENAQVSTSAPDEDESEPTVKRREITPGDAVETAKMAALPAQGEVEVATEKIAAIADEGDGVKRKRRPYSKRRRIITLVMLAVVLAGVLVPAGFLISYGVSGYQTYVALKNQAHDGVDHLLNVKTIFTGVKTHPSGFLDATKLNRSRQEFMAAQTDFIQLQYKIEHTPIIQTVTTFFPQYLSEVQTARSASRIGIDVSEMGLALTATALQLAPTLRGSLLTSSSKPLVTQDMLNLVGTTISELLPRLTDIQQQSRLLSLASLPVTAVQRDEFGQLLQLIPQAESDLEQVLNLLGAANWLLGIDSPRTFLVQTMDRAELRPTGGFTGQYGELTIKGGRVGPFSLKDISLVEYVANSETIGKLTPAQYQSWWPFANWGLRDSNLSADLPTSAQIAIQQYQLEVGHKVDGVILFTPFLIEHVLQIIGPVRVPGYNDTITAQNLEDRLHYYQQDNSGIAKQVVYQPGDTTTSARKRFTSYLAQLILSQVRHAPPDELLAIGQEVLHDLKTKDLQVYFTDPQAESLLTQYGDAAQLNRSTSQDGLYVVQANVSANKASQYVKTILHDTVTLDAAGGATHVLQLRLVYNQIGPVYGYDTYRDYVRVYVPPGSKLLWGNGFDTGVPLCGGSYVQCPQTDVYPQDQLVCPTGQYQPGAHAPTISDPSGGSWGPLDTIGPPTNLNSDEPGRAMFGGWVIVPKNCTMNVTLSWYVPPMGKSYSLLVQKQAGMFPELDLTILPTPGDCASMGVSSFHFDGIMGEDMAFSPMPYKAAARSNPAGCYPQPGV
ncbi:MAG TPA: DUF4012 domain-containing protein [Ktedonobacteraceae bacterium]|nr:DUF4012 domain-containing protein [Ktedonobacteraceae bacterium]